MGIGTALGGLGLLKVASFSVRNLLRSAVGGNLIGKGAWQKSWQTYAPRGWGRAAIPGWGVAKLFHSVPKALNEMKDLRAGVSRSMKGVLKAKAGKSWWSEELRECVFPSFERTLSSIGLSANEAKLHSIKMFRSARSSLSSGVLPNVTELYEDALVKAGMSAKSNAFGMIKRDTDWVFRSIKAGFDSRELFTRTLAANSAIIGLPGLVSTVGTLSVMHALKRKAADRLRGYQSY